MGLPDLRNRDPELDKLVRANQSSVHARNATPHHAMMEAHLGDIMTSSVSPQKGGNRPSPSNGLMSLFENPNTPANIDCQDEALGAISILMDEEKYSGGDPENLMQVDDSKRPILPTNRGRVGSCASSNSSMGSPLRASTLKTQNSSSTGNLEKASSRWFIPPEELNRYTVSEAKTTPKRASIPDWRQSGSGDYSDDLPYTRDSMDASERNDAQPENKPYPVGSRHFSRQHSGTQSSLLPP